MNIPLSEFWRMTPYELFICMESFEQNEKERSKEIIVQAYYTEAFARMKKLPDLEELLKEKKEEQSNEDMLEAIKRMNAVLGGQVY